MRGRGMRKFTILIDPTAKLLLFFPKEKGNFRRHNNNNNNNNKKMKTFENGTLKVLFQKCIISSFLMYFSPLSFEKSFY